MNKCQRISSCVSFRIVLQFNNIIIAWINILI